VIRAGGEHHGPFGEKKKMYGGRRTS
jgi:hypothetical protein